jgi:hypothetical protein
MIHHEGTKVLIVLTANFVLFVTFVVRSKSPVELPAYLWSPGKFAHAVKTFNHSNAKCAKGVGATGWSPFGSDAVRML